jgi:hypothetical protein
LDSGKKRPLTTTAKQGETEPKFNLLQLDKKGEKGRVKRSHDGPHYTKRFARKKEHMDLRSAGPATGGDAPKIINSEPMHGSDISPSTETLNFLCEKKEPISFIKLVENSNLDNLYSKPECHVLSNAFSMSKNTAAVDI